MVSPMWRGETVAVLATGPSLTPADVEFVRGRARVIAVNDSYRLAPWADILYAADDKWWQWQYRDHAAAIASFTGLRFCMEPGNLKKSRPAAVKPEWRVTVLKNAGVTGLELDPSAGLKNGRNSGYAAINLAVQLGATRIRLLGYDMSLGRGGKAHWFGSHPAGGSPQLTKFRLYFPTIAEPLKASGVEVLNCSRRSALTCFPKVALERALPLRQVA